VTPTGHQLGAALVAGSILDRPLALERALESWRALPTGGEFVGNDLENGSNLLLRAELLEAGSHLAPTPMLAEILSLPEEEARRVLLLRILQRERPPWLEGAVSEEGKLREALIPDVAVRVLTDLYPDLELREAVLIALGQRVDLEGRDAVGAEAELLVVQACRDRLVALGREDLCAGVRRVSQHSDLLGYDVVTPTLSGRNWRMEVKAARREASHWEVVLSRMEFEHGMRDPRWRLVACRVGRRAGVLGFVLAGEVSGRVPLDRPGGRWADARLALPGPHAGLPPLGGC